MEGFLGDSWRDALTVAGCVLGLVSVGFAMYILCVARRAEQAAREARSAIRRQSLAEEAGQALQLANECLTHIEGENWAAGRIRALDLSAACVRLLQRWQEHLGAEQGKALRRARNTLERLLHVLAQEPGPGLAQEDRDEVSELARRARDDLASVHGAAHRRAEEGGH
jgi:hypothetical protein